MALKWGAKYGIAEGLQGQTYALPTMGKNSRRLSLDKVKMYVDRFLPNPQLHFLITDVGCGLAGFKGWKHVPNVSLPAAFLDE